MTAGTPMGEAAPGSRLARMHEAQQILRPLHSRGMTRRWIAAELGVSPATTTLWRTGRGGHRRRESRRCVPWPKRVGRG